MLTCTRLEDTKENGPVSTTTFSLPPLRPPVDGLVALLTVPPTATLHTPISISLAIRNHPTSRSANITVQLDLDASDSFVVAGLRSGRVPILLPGAEERLSWKLIPTECGHVKLPRIRVTNRRKPMSNEVAGSSGDAETVKIIDVRLSQHNSSEDKEGPGTILVLPY